MSEFFKGSFLKFWYTIIILFTFGYVIFGSIHFPKDNMGQDDSCNLYSGTWYQVLEDGTKVEIELPCKLDVKRGEKMVLSTTLPKDIAKHTNLCFRSAKQDINFYIDGKLSGTYSNKMTRKFGTASPVGYFFLDIDSWDAGKELIVEAVTDTSYTGNVYEVYQGEQMGFWKMIFKKNLVQNVIIIGMLFISAVLSLLTFIVQRTRGVNSKIHYLALGIFLAYVWEMANTDIRQIIAPNLSVISDLAFMMVMIIPLPFLTYFNSVQDKKYDTYYSIVEGIVILDFFICLSLHAAHIVDFDDSFKYIALTAGLAILTVVATIILDFAKKRIDSYANVAYGMICVMVATIVQITLYILKIEKYGGAILFIGLLILFTFAIKHTLVLIQKEEQEKQEAILLQEAKSKFLAKMSHEIRTPVNAVLGMNTMILRETTENNIRGYALDIMGAGESLLTLINDILDMSKIESGKMEIVEAKYDLSVLIHDVINMVALKMKAKGLSLELEIDPKLPTKLLGDDIRIRQILINIMNNAVKYTEQGSVRLQVTGEKKEDKVLLHVSIKDTGIGIKEEDLGKLFQEFERIDEERNRNIEGVGLGMSITTQLLTLMGSKLQVESVYGIGSDFYFDLYQTIVDEEPIGDFEARIETRTDTYNYSTPFIAPNAKILLVDDNDMNRMVFVNLLKQTKIAIDQAGSGFDAIELAKKNVYDIIVLDHMMPGLDGIETLHILREQEIIGEKTIVIAFTANAIAGAKEEYLAAGFCDYLSKPVEIDKLEKMLIRYLPQEKIVYKKSEDSHENTVGKSIIDVIPKEPIIITKVEDSDQYTGNSIDVVAQDEETVSMLETGQMAINLLVKEEESEKENMKNTENAIGISIVEAKAVEEDVAIVEKAEGKVIDADSIKKACPDLQLDTAMTYCMGDMEFFIEVLKTFVSTNKVDMLNDLYHKEEYDDYRIQVHALKSTSKTMGLTELSEHARMLEMAAKEGDIDYIKDMHDALMEEYEAILASLRALVG